MLYLLLAIASSAAIAILMRFTAGRVTGSITMLAVNYLACLLLAAAYTGFHVIPFRSEGFFSAVGMGAGNGVLYLLGFVLMQYNTRKNGVVLSSVFMKLGLLVPIVLSVLLFGELPTGMQAAGFLLAVGAIVLINYQKGERTFGMRLPLLIMLLASGGGDAMSKVFSVYGVAAMEDCFLFYTFVSACLLCVPLILWKREQRDWRAILFGLLVGIPNFYSARFLLLALGELPAVIVYPTFSVATMLVVTLAGVGLFRERLRRTQWAALGIIMLALILLHT